MNTTDGTALPGVAYARLGLAPGAPIAEVKRAYRRLAMHHHPDRAGARGLSTFLAVKAAYEWIVAHPLHAEPRDPSPADRRTGWPGGRWYWEGRRAVKDAATGEKM